MLTPILTLVAVMQTIHVPGDYPTLLEATLAAPDGATVHVHGGVHEALTVDGKSLTVFAEPRAELVGLLENGGLTNPVNLVGRWDRRPNVTIRNFVMRGSAWPNTNATVDGFYMGRVTFENCEIRGFDWVSPYSLVLSGLPGIALRETEAVVLIDCEVSASNPIAHGFGLDGTTAVEAPQATVTAIRSVLRGGAAGQGHGEADGGHVGRVPVGGLAVHCTVLRYAASDFYAGDAVLPDLQRAIMAERVVPMLEGPRHSR